MKHATCAWLVLIATASGCLRSSPGRVRYGSEPAASPIVSIESGRIDLGMGALVGWYLVDRGTQTCWFLVQSATAMDCCNLRLVPSAAPIITWETDATCRATAPPPAPPATPPAPQPPSATP